VICIIDRRFCDFPLRKIFAVAACIAGVAFAQTADDQFRPKITAVRYPPLAVAARVQGDVRLSVSSGQVNIVSGPPLLVQTAVESAKSFVSIQQDEATLGLLYHFAVIGPTTVPIPTTVRKGDAFDRIFLRMLGLKTERVVVEKKCQQGVAPANDIKVSGANIEIWIYGSGGCLMTETSTLLARR
jgi:hypothetical protein